MEGKQIFITCVRAIVTRNPIIYYICLYIHIIIYGGRNIYGRRMRVWVCVETERFLYKSRSSVIDGKKETLSAILYNIYAVGKVAASAAADKNKK